jgi:hypothetical protein
MTGKDDDNFENRSHFYRRCEWFALRTVVFIVFVYELSKYVRSLWR